jgi:hypothetical protein
MIMIAKLRDKVLKTLPIPDGLAYGMRIPVYYTDYHPGAMVLHSKLWWSN